MSIAIFGSLTGNGHLSVLNSLKESFEIKGYKDILYFPSFYEDISISTKVLSDFYNFLLSNSIKLCNQYCEFNSLNRYDISDKFYKETEIYLNKLLSEYTIDTIISVTHSINHAIIKYIKTHNLNIRFYIIITDPFYPYAVGYDVEGADGYFCASDIVKNELIKRNIKNQLIHVIDYPISKKFFRKYNIKKIKEKIGIPNNKKVILLNSGSQGNISYYKYFKELSEICKVYIIFLAGKNEALYNACCNYRDKKNMHERISIYKFTNRIEEFLSISDIVITKGGANSLFESIAMNIPIALDMIEGGIFQEIGARHLIEQLEIGIILDDKTKLKDKVLYAIDNNLQTYKRNMQNFINQSHEDLITNIIIEDKKE